MSTTTLDRQQRTRSAGPQWLRVAVWHLRSVIRLMTWVWGLAVVLAAFALLTISQTTDVVPTLSAIALGHQAFLWIPTGAIASIASTSLALHVVSGMTRRSFTVAASIVTVGVGVFNAVVGTLVLLVERAAYDALGWAHGSAMTGAEVLAGGEMAYASGLALMFCAAAVSGLVAGTSFYRFGGRRGALMLPLALVPLLAVSLVGIDYSTQWGLWGTGPGLPHSPLFGVAAIALGLVGYAYLVRRVPITPAGC